MLIHSSLQGVNSGVTYTEIYFDKKFDFAFHKLYENYDALFAKGIAIELTCTRLID